MFAVIALVLFVGVVVSDIALLVSAANTKGVGLWEYIQLSDFGIFVLQFGVHPVWAVVNILVAILAFALCALESSR